MGRSLPTSTGEWTQDIWSIKRVRLRMPRRHPPSPPFGCHTSASSHTVDGVSGRVQEALVACLGWFETNSRWILKFLGLFSRHVTPEDPRITKNVRWWGIIRGVVLSPKRNAFGIQVPSYHSQFRWIRIPIGQNILPKKVESKRWHEWPMRGGSSHL